MNSQHEDIMAEIDEAKINQRRGKTEVAKPIYMDIINRRFMDHGAQVNNYAKGIVAHQLGSIYAIEKNIDVARIFFGQAHEMLRKDPFALGIALRDEAHAEALLDNFKKARELLNEALKQFSKPSASERVTKEKLEVEIAVTHGFFDRINLMIGRNIQESVANLRSLHTRLSTYGKKPEYIVPNLGWIIDYIDDAWDREKYIVEATQFSDIVGNVQKKHEYEMFLRGGETLREAYLLVNTAKSFGTSVLKGVIAKIR